jgi:hypothetical protein
MNKQQMREQLDVRYVPVPPTTLPVCGTCGAVLAEDSIEQHHRWHKDNKST